jgi:hypothetical protein
MRPIGLNTRKIFSSQYLSFLLAILSLSGCSAIPAPKFENGQYVPPPAEHALTITLESNSCDAARSAGVVTAVLSVIGPALANYTYDQFVNWLDTKQANLSASSSGVATQLLYDVDPVTGTNQTLKGCLTLNRSDNLKAKFNLKPTSNSGNATYWHMTPYSLEFTKSEAKEGANKKKSLVADIAFATPGADGKLTTFFQGTFDLGNHVATLGAPSVDTFIGQDSGPVLFPKPIGKDYGLTIKVTASIIEHGEGRDWIRGVTDSLREKENRDQILKPILDSISK